MNSQPTERKHEQHEQREHDRQRTISLNQARRLRFMTIPLQLNGEPVIEYEDGLYCPLHHFH